MNNRKKFSIEMVAAAALCTAALGIAAPARAEPVDCPAINAPFSIDLPLIDILANPQAVAVVNKDAPGMLAKLAPQWKSMKVPTLATTITLRHVAKLTLTPEDTLRLFDRDFALLDVKDSDKAARCARYDNDKPAITMPAPGKPRILIFEKVTGLRDGAAIDALDAAFKDMAMRNGWTVVTTDKGGAISADILKDVDILVWNNISGDVLTFPQRLAFKTYMERGGGFIGVHASSGDPGYFWEWYLDKVVGARFVAHPEGALQVQPGKIVVAGDSKTGIGKDLAPGWTMKDEWYSFGTNPRNSDGDIIATLDEASYKMGASPFTKDMHTGDHPVAWTRCVGNGRSFYAAMGHGKEPYANPQYLKLLEESVPWVAGQGSTKCASYRLVPK